MSLNTIPEIIEDIRRGRMVVIMDDEDRENEGDLIMSATHVSAQDVNFMARYARGLICLTLTQERCRQLRLPLMVADTDEKHTTNFTVSIEAAEGVSTGISAADRARTIQAAVSPNATYEDIVMPGHIFPLMAQPGGVLTRAGHTEAGCDLSRLAGLEPASVIVEILNEDGTMARRPELEVFAQEHGLKIGTVADLIRYRMENEQTVRRGPSAPINTEFGDFQLISYEDIMERTCHLVLIKGQPDLNQPVLVRVHVHNTLNDIAGIHIDEQSWTLRDAMHRLEEEGQGIMIILRKAESPQQLLNRIRDLTAPGQDGHGSGSGLVLRTYGTGAQILKDLGVRRMRVLSAPKIMHGLSGFGLEVIEYVE